jgi:hypothetical protein
MQLSSVVSKTCAILILSVSFSFAFAAEKVLCIVTNDVDKETGKMVYEMDEEARVIKHLYKEKYVNDKLVDRVEMNAADLLGDGVVLHKKDKYVTVRLYSHNFDVSSGGVLFLDTLYNGIKGERKEYAIEARIDGGTDAIMSYENKAFSRMHFVAKRSGILGVIGIEKVNFSK